MIRPNTNLHPISHRFEVIADYWSNLRFWGTLWGLGATYDVHLRLIGKLVGDFLLVIIELLLLGAFVLSQFTRVTDGRTDRQTDGHVCRREDRPAYMQRGKKVKINLHASVV